MNKKLLQTYHGYRFMCQGAFAALKSAALWISPEFRNKVVVFEQEFMQELLNNYYLNKQIPPQP